MKEKELQDINENAQHVISWMEEKLGAQLPKKSFHELISDGVLFCRLANALKPGCVRKFHRQPKLLMMQIENAGMLTFFDIVNNGPLLNLLFRLLFDRLQDEIWSA